jgi:hypothetical protein
MTWLLLVVVWVSSISGLILGICYTPDSLAAELMGGAALLISVLVFALWRYGKLWDWYSERQAQAWRQMTDRLADIGDDQLRPLRDLSERMANEPPPQLWPRGGRPRNPDDEWAREQVKLGCNREEVFQEWHARNTKSGRNLHNEQDSFNKMLHRTPGQKGQNGQNTVLSG